MVGQDHVVELAHDLDGERLGSVPRTTVQPTPVSPTLTSAYGIVSGHSPGVRFAAVAGAVIGQSAAVMITSGARIRRMDMRTPLPVRTPWRSRVTRSWGRPCPASMIARTTRVPSSGRSWSTVDSLIRYRATTVSPTSTRARARRAGAPSHPDARSAS